jgi:hypothetical protein
MKTKVVAIPHPDKAAKGQFRNIGGSQSDVWNKFLMASVTGSLASSSDRYSKESQSTAKTATLVGIASCDLSDPLEAIIVGEIMFAHSNGLELRRLAWIKGQPFEVSTRYLALADKSARTVATLTETLNRASSTARSSSDKIIIDQRGDAPSTQWAHRGCAGCARP